MYGAFDQRYGGEGAAELVDLQFPEKSALVQQLNLGCGLGVWDWGVRMEGFSVKLEIARGELLGTPELQK